MGQKQTSRRFCAIGAYAQPGRVAAHEGNEQAAEMYEADSIDMAGRAAQRACHGYIAA
jgi:hypothetical protein